MPTLTRPRNHIAFVELTEGEVEPGARANCESTLFSRLEANSVAPGMVVINAAGCFFTINEREAARVRSAATTLNVALRIRTACARITLNRAQTDWPLPSLANVLIAIGGHGFEAIHITADSTSLDVVVTESHAELVSGILSTFCQSKPSCSTAP